jgi:DNA-binding transcriptional LysR family regulator
MSQQLLNKLKLIGVFCHVVESGSMREAAVKLGISSPAVSQFISQLEADLGVTLLYRSTRRLGVSEAGERYYQWGKKMLQAAEQA